MAGGQVIRIINHYAGSRVHGMEYRHYYLATHFRRSTSGSSATLREQGKRGRRYVHDTHTYEVLAQRYARLF